MITIKGKAEYATREEIRAWVHATLCILGYHNLQPKQNIFISITRLRDAGDCTRGLLIRLNRWCEKQEMFTTIVHELIHELCGDFGKGTDEKCTSTLTARLKPEIGKIAQALLDGTYKRAAFIAHTKLSYRTTHDHYDPAQDKSIVWKPRWKPK